MTSQGFPQSRRLHLKNDFKNIIQGGHKIQGYGLVLWWKPAPLGKEDRRMGLVVSKRLGSAVVRNRVKRLLREAFRLNRERLQSGVDYIFSPRSSESLATADMAENAVLSLCRKAGLVPPLNAADSCSAQTHE